MGIDPVTHAPRMDLLELAALLGSSLYSSPSQLNVPAVAPGLGVGPMVNSDVLTLATALMSSHCENPEFQIQNLQQIQLRNSQRQFQNQLDSYNSNLQSSIQEVQACPASTAAASTPFLNQMHTMQAISEHLTQTPNDSGFQNSLPDLWQPHGGQFNTVDSFTNLNTISNNKQNFSFDSVRSTPSSSSTPVTYAAGSTEDERDSYCSNLLMFDIPSGLDVNAIM